MPEKEPGSMPSASVPPHNTRSITNKKKLEKQNSWKCPDPGCKTQNYMDEPKCSTCTLPKQSCGQLNCGSKLVKKL